MPKCCLLTQEPPTPSTGTRWAHWTALSIAGLMHVASNEHSAVAVPTWGSETAVQVILGRAAGELRRIPVAELATAAFESMIRPRLGPFDAANYGVGAPSMASASEGIASFHRRPRDGVVHLGGQGPGHRYPSVSRCGAALRIGELPRGWRPRRRPLDRLAHLSEDLWGEDVTLEHVFPTPSSTVPSLRFH